MNSPGNSKKRGLAVLFLGFLLLAVACAVARPAELLLLPAQQPKTLTGTTRSPQRPVYWPGELVAYTAQSGDNLPSLAGRFNTSELAIRKANPIIPANATTLPQGLPMQIPIYYTPFWGSDFKIIPNSAFVFSATPEYSEFESLILGKDGYSELFRQLTGQEGLSEIFWQACLQASIDPRLLLSLIGYGFEPNSGLQSASSALLESISRQNMTLMQCWLELLNAGYYGFETGRMLELELSDGTIERLDPWQNAGSAALHYFFSQMLETTNDYQQAVAPDGFAATYQKLFGDPWDSELEVLPGSLDWISAGLPINPQGGWQAAPIPESLLTSMPVSGMMAGFHASIQDSRDKEAYGKVYACIGGTITRMEASQLVVSQIGMQENQGWSLVYYGLSVKPGLKVGDKVEIGESIGHVDASAWNASFWLARKYNGEWVPAGAIIPFKLGGWKLALDDDSQSLVMLKPELTVYSQPYQDQTNLIPAN